MPTRPAEPAAARAYAATKDLILTGRIPAGSLISEGEIAEQLDISRTPVREAFLRLQGEELLRLIPKRGAVVVPVPPTEAEDILDLRMALETAAVRRLVDRAVDCRPLLAELDELLRRQRGRADDADVAGFAEVDELFHRAIVTAAGNGIATRCYAGLADRQRRMTIGAVGPRAHRLSDLMSEHAGLMAKVRAGDVTGFETALRTHLDNTHSAVLSR